MLIFFLWISYYWWVLVYFGLLISPPLKLKRRLRDEILALCRPARKWRAFKTLFVFPSQDQTVSRLELKYVSQSDCFRHIPHWINWSWRKRWRNMGDAFPVCVICVTWRNGDATFVFLSRSDTTSQANKRMPKCFFTDIPILRIRQFSWEM